MFIKSSPNSSSMNFARLSRMTLISALLKFREALKVCEIRWEELRFAALPGGLGKRGSGTFAKRDVITPDTHPWSVRRVKKRRPVVTLLPASLMRAMQQQRCCDKHSMTWEYAEEPEKWTKDGEKRRVQSDRLVTFLDNSFR